MKKLSLVLILALGACSGAHNENGVTPPPQDTNFAAKNAAELAQDNSHTYRITDGCDSGPRVFPSDQEMCLSLQIDENNNGCTQEQRIPEYERRCGKWAGDSAAVNKFYFTDGGGVYCLFAEGRGPGQEHMSNSSSIIQQRTRSNTMIMQQAHTKAIISTGSVQGKLAVNIQLFDLNGNKLAERTGTPDSPQPQIPTAGSHAFDRVELNPDLQYRPSVICYPYTATLNHR